MPQGSILGPLLFIIYVNDIGNTFSSQARLYADDCTIFRNVSSQQDQISLQRDLNQLFEWTQKWHLALNITKCKAMIISNKRINMTPLKAYSINSNQLDWVETYKYLGVIIHKKLLWSNHILQGSSKAMKVLNLLRRTMHGTSNTSKELAYIALVRPHLEYCSPVWNPHQKKYIQDLEKVQKRAARWVGGVRWDSSTKSWTESYNTTCLKLGWLSLVNRRTYLDCYQTFKIINGLDCINFKDYFKQNKGNLRSNRLTIFLFLNQVSMPSDTPTLLMPPMYGISYHFQLYNHKDLALNKIY